MHQPKKNFQDQCGAVLIIGLIMLLLLTMIGLASIRGSDLQERMAGNMRDRNLAFQSAEAGLRIAEDQLSVAETLPSFSGSVIGYWPDLNKPSAIRPRPTTWTALQWGANSLQVDNDTLGGVLEQPRYVFEQVIVSATVANQGGGIDIESLEKMQEAEYYRITARGVGGTADAEAILQSTFIR